MKKNSGIQFPLRLISLIPVYLILLNSEPLVAMTATKPLEEIKHTSFSKIQTVDGKSKVVLKRKMAGYRKTNKRKAMKAFRCQKQKTKRSFFQRIQERWRTTLLAIGICLLVFGSFLFLIGLAKAFICALYFFLGCSNAGGGAMIAGLLLSSAGFGMILPSIFPKAY